MHLDFIFFILTRTTSPVKLNRLWINNSRTSSPPVPEIKHQILPQHLSCRSMIIGEEVILLLVSYCRRIRTSRSLFASSFSPAVYSWEVARSRVLVKGWQFYRQMVLSSCPVNECDWKRRQILLVPDRVRVPVFVYYYNYKDIMWFRVQCSTDWVNQAKSKAKQLMVAPV